MHPPPPPSTFASRRRAGLVLLAFLLASPVAIAGTVFSLTRMQNDVLQWLPADYPETQRYLGFLQHFDPDAFVLVSWEGCTLDDPRVEKLASTLVGPPSFEGTTSHSKYFSRVITGPSVIRQLMEPPIRLSRAEAVERMRGSLVGPDSRTTCAVFALTEHGVFHMRAALAELKRTAQSAAGLAPDELKLGGPPVDNVALDTAGEQSMLIVLAATTGFGLIVCWWCLRRPLLIALVVTVGLATVAFSLATFYYTGGVMNAIVLGMPALVYVAAISGAIHLANYYQEQVTLVGPERAPAQAVRLAALPLALATFTTAVGLLSLTVSELTPIRDFGIYSAIGVFWGLAGVLLLLPAALRLWPVLPAPVRESGWRMPWQRLGGLVLDHPLIATVAIGSLMLLAGLGLPRIETSVHIMRLFGEQARIRQDYTWLESRLGPLSPVEIVVRFSGDCPLDFRERLGLVRQLQGRIDALPAVGTSLSAATFAPSAARRASSSRVVNETVEKVRLARHREDFRRTGFYREAGEDELWRITARVTATGDIDYQAFAADVDGAVAPVERALAREGIAGVHVSYTGVLPIVYQAQNSLLDGMIVGYATDVALIVLAMIVAVRSLSAGVLLLAPSLLPALLVFGWMGYAGWIVDMGTVMPPAVALGVTVDDIMHFLLCFRRELNTGATRRQAIEGAYAHCGRAMYQSWAVLGVGILAFSFSPFVPTQRFGYIMAALLTAGLLGNFILLPALLAGPLGGVWERQIRRRAAISKKANAVATENVDADIEGRIFTGRITAAPDHRERPLATPDRSASDRSEATASSDPHK